jgi:AraC-like DNA-binding protein
MDPGGSSIPRLVFARPDLSGHQQFELAHDQIAPAIDTAPLAPTEQFRGGSMDYLIGDAGLSNIHFTAQALRRRRRHFTTSTTEMVGVLVPRSGSIAGEIGQGTSVEAGVGTALVVDFALPFHLQSRGTDLLWLTLPRARVAAVEQLRRTERAAVLDASTSSGRAVMAAMATTWDELPDASAERGPVLADHLIDVVNRALAPGELVLSPEALLASMKSFLREHLHDLDLGVDDLQRAFHCSRSSVYRLFEADGGVARFIRRERLERCMHELMSPTLHPHRVSTVAVRWGYENPSHFNRLFKQAFGAAPSVVARRSRAARDWHDPDLSLEISRLHEWIGA